MEHNTILVMMSALLPDKMTKLCFYSSTHVNDFVIFQEVCKTKLY